MGMVVDVHLYMYVALFVNEQNHYSILKWLIPIIYGG